MARISTHGPWRKMTGTGLNPRISDSEHRPTTVDATPRIAAVTAWMTPSSTWAHRTCACTLPAAIRRAPSRRRRPALMAMTATPPVQATRNAVPNRAMNPPTSALPPRARIPKAKPTRPIARLKGMTVAEDCPAS